MGEKSWDTRGTLPSGALPDAVAVSPQGYGLVASRTEPEADDPTELLRGRKAQLTRVTAAGAQQVYDGAGWIQALDGQGELWFAVAATLKASGSGSDYRLLRSTDGGKSWQPRGSILAGSVTQVLAVTQNEAWVLGAGSLGCTVDGGKSWTPVAAEGERDHTVERLRRFGEGVALLGHGFATTLNGGNTWVKNPVGGAHVRDLEGKHLVVDKDGKSGVGVLEGQQIRWLSGLPAGRWPLRLALAGSTVRVLTRASDPAQGVDLTLYRSENGGQSWTEIKLGPFRAEADIAGDCGLGVELIGTLRAAL